MTQQPPVKTTPSDAYRQWTTQVWQVVEGIPPGHVLTYGEVARLAGMSGLARRVSQALSKAPRDRNVPWHRVVNAQGRISIPPDSPSHAEQKRRLEREGVVFLNGRINLERYGYQGALDQLLWSEPL